MSFLIVLIVYHNHALCGSVRIGHIMVCCAIYLGVGHGKVRLPENQIAQPVFVVILYLNKEKKAQQHNQHSCNLS